MTTKTTEKATKVEVYGTDWCGLTQTFRDDLSSSNVPFEYHNIERDSDAERQVTQMNGGKRKFPMVVIGDKALKNPAQDELDAVLGELGLLESRKSRS